MSAPIALPNNPLIPVLVPITQRPPPTTLLPPQAGSNQQLPIPTTPSTSAGGGAVIYPGGYNTFPSAASVQTGIGGGNFATQFAIDPTFPGGGQASLYCAQGGVWCFMMILSP